GMLERHRGLPQHNDAGADFPVLLGDPAPAHFLGNLVAHPLEPRLGCLDRLARVEETEEELAPAFLVDEVEEASNAVGKVLRRSAHLIAHPLDVGTFERCDPCPHGALLSSRCRLDGQTTLRILPRAEAPMKTYVVLLRGINLGPRNRVAM